MMKYFLPGLIWLMCLLIPCGAEAAGAGDRSKDFAQISGLKINSEGNKVRIVLSSTRAVSYSQMTLNNPNRIVVDIKNAYIDSKDKTERTVVGRYVGKVRVAQFDETTVRLVIHTKVGFRNHKIFTLDKDGKLPYRLVIDVGSGSASGLNIDLWSKKKIDKTDSEEETEKSAPPSVDDDEDDDERPKGKKYVATDDEDEDEDKDEEKPKPKRRFFDFGNRDVKNDEGAFSETDKAIAELTGLKGRVIAIDPGHGGSDPGAIGPTGVTEKAVTLKVALELKKLLEKEGAVVHMTRTRDTEVSRKGSKATDIEELQARCDIANKSKADIFISIHMDSFTNPEANGTTGYYYAQGSAKSRSLADKIRAGVIEQIRTNSRGTQPCNFYVVRNTDMPATLLEVAFISNRAEEKLLNSDEGAKRAAQGIADGIADYFG